MKPVLEEYAGENPDIKFYNIEVEYDEKTKLPQKWQLELLPNSWTFPVVQCFAKGVKMLQMGSIFPVDLLGNAFLSESALQSNFANSVLLIDMLKKEHRKTLEAIGHEQKVSLAVLSRINRIKNNIQDDDWELPTPTIGEDGKKACEACQ